MELSYEGPKCPYCGKQYIADGPYYYDEMEYTHETCDHCGNDFTVRVDISTSWETEKRDTKLIDALKKRELT